MILFKNNYYKLSNKIINNFIRIEKYKYQDDIGDIIEKIMPKYLYREQFKKCTKTFEDIYNWSCDKFNHDLSLFHRLVLYKFLKYIDKKSKRVKNFKDRYFNNECKLLIESAIKLENRIDVITDNNFYDIDWFINFLFEDKKFLIIEDLYNKNKLDEYLLRNKESIKIYYDILPLELQEKYKLEEVDIFKEVNNLLKFIQTNIKKYNLALMFWENGKEMSEPKIQIVLENIIDAYFYNNDIDINRESLVGSGNIDFKFYKHNNEKILFELKKASNTHLIDGYQNQLIKYMKSCECKRAFYIIICFTDKDYRKAKRFIDTCEKTDEYHEYIDIVILDVRLKKSFININKTKMNKQIPEEVDNYFSHINRILTLTNVEDIKNYLILLKQNYYNIKDKKLKEEYIKRIHSLGSKHVNPVSIFDRYLNEDSFYKIIDSKTSARELILDLTNSITFEKAFETFVNSTIDIYESLIDRRTERITEEQIKEIFSFLKNKHYKIYKFLTKINLEIYLFDSINESFNSLTIPSLNFKNFDLLCFNMIDCDSNKISPIHDLLYQIGLIVCWSASKNFTYAPIDFIKILEENLVDFKLDGNNSLALFGEFFAISIMLFSEYKKYLPDIHKKFTYELYEKMYKYFENLISELLQQDYEGVNYDMF